MLTAFFAQEAKAHIKFEHSGYISSKCFAYLNDLTKLDTIFSLKINLVRFPLTVL